MTRYVVGRLLQAGVSWLVMAVVIFTLVSLLGDPVTTRLPIGATEETRRQIASHLGVDRPWLTQLRIYLSDVVTGDFGRSNEFGQPVRGIIGDRLAATVSLSALAMVFSMLVGVPLGVIAARHLNSRIDRTIRLAAVVGQSTPPFWVAIVLLIIFGVRLGWLPTSGRGGPDSYVLPTVTMVLFIAPGIVRIVRSSMVDVLNADYTRFARALRVPERVIVWTYGLRAASVPIVTYAGLVLLSTLTGAVVTETVFAWPGLGQLAVRAVFSRDFPMVEGVVLLVTGAYLLGNLLIDISYTWLDPRISLDGR